MDSVNAETTTICHVVAMPYPGRGHINPMMNLCKMLVAKKDDILITFVVTEEWFSFIGCDSKPNNIRFASIPNVIPSELVRAANFLGFFEAVKTKMEAPFEQLLDQLELPVTNIIADAFLMWAIRVGNQRNIPVAALFTAPATVFSKLHHFDLSEQGNKISDNIPGISTTHLSDRPTVVNGNIAQILEQVLESVLWVSKAQYLLFTLFYELEPQAIDTLRAKYKFPVYPVGPTIPYLQLEANSMVTSSHNGLDYIQWLNSQPRGSVLYVSMGSFLSLSSAQMDEIVAGVRSSGVRYLWVAREDTSQLKDGCGDKGMVVPWCDQLRVLCHSSVGGFWTHCGWNSTLEAIYAGVPMLTFPIVFDQVSNGKKIVEDWKIGWRVNREVGGESLATREEIAELVERFMDMDSSEGKEMGKRARELQEVCRVAIAKGGSSHTNLDSFIKDISQGHVN